MGMVSASRRRSVTAGVGFVLVLAALSVAVTAAAGRSVAPAPRAVYSIEMPHEEPHVPPGPHAAEFTAYCRLCHSPRMVLTQPRLTEKQWGAVVKKMETVYGAPIPPSQEPDIIAYLMAVRGPETKAK